MKWRLSSTRRGLLLALCALLLPAVVRADDADTFVLNVAGDVGYPSNWGRTELIDRDKAGLFRLVKPILDTGDVNFANMECPFSERGPQLGGQWSLTCHPMRLAYVVDAGFNALSLANNHALDAGAQGLANTLRLVAEAHRPDRPLWTVGLGKTAAEGRLPVVFTPPGKHHRVALFAVASTHPKGPVGSIFDPTLPERIRKAAAEVDVVLVSAHFGVEFVHQPTGDAVRRYHQLIDAGADVVIGHHPHVIQGVERYRDGVILYSLGNFSFGAMATPEKLADHHGWRMYSLLGRLTFRGGSLHTAELVPLYAHNQLDWTLGDVTLEARHATPQLLAGPFAAYVIDELRRFSEAVPGASPTRLVTVGDRAYVDLGNGAPAPAEHPRLEQQQRQEYAAILRDGAAPRAATADDKQRSVRPAAIIRQQPTPEMIRLWLK